MTREFRTKTEKVFSNLQQEIIKGLLKPGSRLVISQLAKQYQVSEIPVREALQRLAHEGYIQLNPHSGAVVSSLSENDIREIFELRIYLECLATRLALDHLSNSHLKQLEEMIEESREYQENGDFTGYGMFNRKFHNFIYQHCNNTRMNTMINELWDYSSRYPRFFNHVSDMEISTNEHIAILDALKKRDADLAERLVKEHKERVYKQLIVLVRNLYTEQEAQQ